MNNDPVSMDALWASFVERTRRTYALRPRTWGSLPAHEAGDWRQVFYWLTTRTGASTDVPADYAVALSGAQSALFAHDRAGLIRAVDGLTAVEKRVIRDCLRAAAYGPFFREPRRSVLRDEIDWDLDFESIFGVSGEQLMEVADA